MGAINPSAYSNTFSLGTKTSSICIIPVEALKANLPSIFGVSKPFILSFQL